MRLRSDMSEPYTLVVAHDPITDSRLSAADLGVYLRCRWLLDICAPHGCVNWLIRELRMPEAETRESVRRLIECGYLEEVGDAEAEFYAARAESTGVRDAITAAIDDLTPAERPAVARFADLVDQRMERAHTAFGEEQERYLAGE